MGLPKKRKLDLKVKRSELNSGPNDWTAQFIEKNKGLLPRSVLHEDLDKGFVEFVENDLGVVVNGESVPSIFLTLQRWTEFAKTWQHSDKYSNIKIPFTSIVRKPDVQMGTNPADFKIPVRKTFPYMSMPIWDGNKKGMDIYKIPQPVGVDVTYTVRFFTFKMRELNQMNRKVLQTFASGQAYVNIKGHYFPIILESVGDESQVDNLDGKRYYVQTYELKLQGYLVDESEFEVVPGVDRAMVMVEVSDKKPKPIVNFIDSEIEDNCKTTQCIIQFLPGAPTEIRIPIENDIDFSTIDTDNLDTYSITVNGNPVTLPFSVSAGDTMIISIVKTDTTKVSEITLNGTIKI